MNMKLPLIPIEHAAWLIEQRILYSKHRPWRSNKRLDHMNRSLNTLKSILAMAIISLSFTACDNEGCTDPIAENYNENAKKDNGTCDYIYGCTKNKSINFDTLATLDDASCMTFETWEDWILEITKTGLDTNLGFAHRGDDSTSARDVYFLDGKDPDGNSYPEGTMILKHTHNILGTSQEYVGMVKQEKGFNTASGNWEWFVLNEDGEMKTDSVGKSLRGGNLYDGMCIGCHQSATTDFVFSK